MKPFPKILVVHHNTQARRRLALLMADSGFDVRSYSKMDDAAENVRSEWLDLALVDNDLEVSAGETPVNTLKRIQPTMPILLVVPQLDLPLVVQGIRLGVADVVALNDDPRPLLRRVRALLKVETAAATEDSVSAEDLEQIDSVLKNIAVVTGGDPAQDGAPSPEAGADLLRISREKAELESRVARLALEKGGLETELRTLLSQGADSDRFTAELNELRTERELAAATQAAIDEKAGALAGMRAAIANERDALETERKKLETATPHPSKSEEEIARERAELSTWRLRLEAEEDRLAGEATRLRQDGIQVTQERRRWQDDIDLLQAQEANLRAYEARLRQIQAQLESDRVLWFSTNARPVTPTPFANDAALQEAWTKLQRASELLEAERNNFRDDRLAIDAFHVAVKRREEDLRDREARLALREKKLSELPPAPVKASILDAAPAQAVISLTRAPMDLAKMVFGGGKKA